MITLPPSAGGSTGSAIVSALGPLRWAGAAGVPGALLGDEGAAQAANARTSTPATTWETTPRRERPPPVAHMLARARGAFIDRSTRDGRLPVADAAVVQALRDGRQARDDRRPVIALILAHEDLAIRRANVQAIAAGENVHGYRLDVGAAARVARDVLPASATVAAARDSRVRATGRLSPVGRRRVRTGRKHHLWPLGKHHQAVWVVDAVRG